VLGSTLALADASGTVQTQYTFEPFGATTTSGSTSANATQYAGRENDGTGLYFYRARYYHPKLGRFISEDPLGFGGGDLNLYAYVGNGPVNHSDPMGTSAFYIHWWETYNAAVAVGWPVSDAWDLARAVAGMDRNDNQDDSAESANGHGMGGRKDHGRGRQQTCGEAYSGTTDHIVNADSMADALHAIEDSYAHGYASWDGGYTSRHFPGPVHLYNDLWYNDAAESAAEAYLRSLGHALNPAGYQAPRPPNCS
jgi:RHS repeat-associated protein